MKIMACCQWASSSVYYLLGLWSRLVASVPYLKGDAPSLLDEFVPKITEGFITSRLNSVQVSDLSFFVDIWCFLLAKVRSLYNVQAGLQDDLSENPLDNVEVLQDQLDCFPYLCRFQVQIFLCCFSFFSLFN